MIIRSVRMAAASAVVALIFLVGCGESPDPTRFSGPVGPDLNVPPTMLGQSKYFEGRIEATLSLSHIGRGTLRGKGARRGEPDNSEVLRPQFGAGYFVNPNGSPLPPDFLKLKLTNSSGDPVKVEIVEVNSPLGNFAVRPAILSLNAGQSAEPDPMISKLGVASEALDIIVALKLDGKTERQTMKIISVAPEAAPASVRK